MIEKLAVIHCIDYRFPYYTTKFLNTLGMTKKYYQCTVAGGSLPITYKQYCHRYGGGCSCSTRKTNSILKNGVLTNRNISLQLAPEQNKLIILNHQDCGAFKAFLPKTEYPKILRGDNPKEILIHTQSLLLTKDFFQKSKPTLEIQLYLMDINGSVAKYTEDKVWQIIYKGDGENPKGLWWES